MDGTRGGVAKQGGDRTGRVWRGMISLGDVAWPDTGKSWNYSISRQGTASSQLADTPLQGVPPHRRVQGFQRRQGYPKQQELGLTITIAAEVEGAGGPAGRARSPTGGLGAHRGCLSPVVRGGRGLGSAQGRWHRGALDVDDACVHDLTVNLHHDLVVPPCTVYTLCRADGQVVLPQRLDPAGYGGGIQ